MGQTSDLRCAAITACSSFDVRGKPPRLACCNANGDVAYFVLTNSSLDRLSNRKVHNACATCVDINRFGNPWVASCAEDGSICISDLVRDLDNIFEEPTNTPKTSQDGAALNSVLFLDTSVLALGGATRGSFVRLYDARQGANSVVLKSQVAGDTATCLACHHSLPYQLASGDITGRIWLWDLRMNSAVCCKQVHRDSLSSMCFHPEQPNILITASNDGTARYHSLDTLQKLQHPAETNSNVLHATFSSMPCIAVDVAVDEVAGPLLMVAAEDETVLVKTMYG